MRVWAAGFLFVEDNLDFLLLLDPALPCLEDAFRFFEDLLELLLLLDLCCVLTGIGARQFLLIFILRHFVFLVRNDGRRLGLTCWRSGFLGQGIDAACAILAPRLGRGRYCCIRLWMLTGREAIRLRVIERQY